MQKDILCWLFVLPIKWSFVSCSTQNEKTKRYEKSKKNWPTHSIWKKKNEKNNLYFFFLTLFSSETWIHECNGKMSIVDKPRKRRRDEETKQPNEQIKHQDNDVIRCNLLRFVHKSLEHHVKYAILSSFSSMFDSKQMHRLFLSSVHFYYFFFASFLTLFEPHRTTGQRIWIYCNCVALRVGEMANEHWMVNCMQLKKRREIKIKKKNKSLASFGGTTSQRQKEK